MSATQADSTAALQVIEECVAHARRMLASQLPSVESRNYDLLPPLEETVTHLYLVGVMWRFGEQFDLPTPARDRGFVCLMALLIDDGESVKKAEKRIAALTKSSRAQDGRDTPAIVAGYRAEEADATLAGVLDDFRNVPDAAGAPYRMLNRSKPIAAILALAGLVISLLLGRNWGEAIGVGVVLGVATLAVALVIFRETIKVKAMKR
jgi:hypothetical protein